MTLVSLTAAARDTYYVHDHLATTVATVDAAGEIAALEADAFGSPVANAIKPHRYTSKPYDEDIGAYVFPFRNYRPNEARWTAADPSGFPDGTNSTVYTPNPLREIDPWGLVKKLAWMYLSTSHPDIANDRAVPDGLTNYFNYLVDWMNYQDSRWFSNSHYLDDGDIFNFFTVSQPSDFSDYSSYDKIYIVAHGTTSGTQGWYFGSSIISTSTVLSYSSNIVSVYGCNTSEGSISVDTWYNAHESSAKKFLRE